MGLRTELEEPQELAAAVEAWHRVNDVVTLATQSPDSDSAFGRRSGYSGQARVTGALCTKREIL